MSNIEWTDETWARFVAAISIGEPGVCWNWTAGTFSNGYGQFRVGSRKVRAHRAYYERMIGSLPPEKILCHHCDNRLCCNPAHIYVGTHADNASDRGRRGRHGRGSKPQPGEMNGSAKLTEPDVLAIRSAHADGDSYSAISKHFGISKSQVGNIIRGNAWR